MNDNLLFPLLSQAILLYDAGIYKTQAERERALCAVRDIFFREDFCLFTRDELDKVNIGLLREWAVKPRP